MLDHKWLFDGCYKDEPNVVCAQWPLLSSRPYKMTATLHCTTETPTLWRSTWLDTIDEILHGEHGLQTWCCSGMKGCIDNNTRTPERQRSSCGESNQGKERAPCFELSTITLSSMVGLLPREWLAVPSCKLQKWWAGVKRKNSPRWIFTSRTCVTGWGKSIFHCHWHRRN